MVTGEGGFSYNKTDVAGHLVLNKEEVHDSLAWGDIDGDGQLDFVGIESQSASREDDDLELVAVHGATGNILWRALNGEASDALSLADGVLVVLTDDRRRVRGLDPRTGRQLWSIDPPDKVKNDPFDGADPARSLQPRGPFVLFECEDGTCHAIESKTGRVVFWKKGKFEWFALDLPGLACVTSENAEGDDQFELVDLFRNRCVYADRVVLRPVFAQGPGVFCVVHGCYKPPYGGVGNKILTLDPQTYDVRGQQYIEWRDEEGDERLLPMHTYNHDRKSAVVLPGHRVVVGDREHGRLIVLPMGGGRPAGVVGPPQPGYEFRSLAIAQNTLVCAYMKSEGTKKMILMGYDLETLKARWWIPEGIGGTRTDNVLLANWTTVLVPSSRRDERSYKPNNPTAWWHVDPATGQKVTEYPVPELDCVELDGKWLCAFVNTYYYGHPLAYDTERRERVL
jgi:hypothetical protein